MNSRMRRFALSLAAGCALAVAGDRPAQALTTTQTMAVSLTVGSSCTLTTNPLNLGTYVPGVTSSTTISLNCTSGVPWSVDIDGGLNQPPLANTARRVTNGGATPSFVNYTLYKDAARTLLWGSTTAGTAQAGTGTGGAQVLTVSSSANGTSGALPATIYTDTVNVIVTF